MEMLTMGLLCIMVLGLFGVMFVLGAVRKNQRPRWRSEIEKDYDDWPRGER